MTGDTVVAAACAPSLAEDLVEENVALLLARLLDDAPPADWRDPEALSARTALLEAAAVLAGASILDTLVHVREARRNGLVTGPDDAPFEAASDALVALHRALYVYSRDTLHFDGIEVAWRALDAAVGGEITARVMGGLDWLRGELSKTMERG